MTTKEDQNITKPCMAGDFQAHGGNHYIHKVPIEGREPIKGGVTLKTTMSVTIGRHLQVSADVSGRLCLAFGR